MKVVQKISMGLANQKSSINVLESPFSSFATRLPFVRKTSKNLVIIVKVVEKGRSEKALKLATNPFTKHLGERVEILQKYVKI
jgi:hypothetical protein